jgi:putative cardiolipin synthase
MPFVLVLFVYLSLVVFLYVSEQPFLNSSAPEDSIYFRSHKTHSITMIDDGLASLAERIALIDKAQKTLDLEYFIYELDLSSQLITRKLIAAAKRGVKVRLLVDFSAPVFKLKPQFASELSQHGVDIRYYNTTSLLRFISVQHRSHRKLLIMDGASVITGGRNVGDDYFNLSPHYNFLDSDVLIEGEVVAAILKGFDRYWNSNLAEAPDTSSEAKPGEYGSFFSSELPEVEEAFDHLENHKDAIAALNFKSSCSDITYATDLPGVFVQNRRVYSELSKFLESADTEMVGETPYFVLRPDGLELLRKTIAKGVKTTILTNSLESTDAFYTVSALALTLDQIATAGVDLRIYDGSRPQNANMLPEKVTMKWGVHAKRAVVDGKHLLIGTYNVDPRSANLNSELLIICRNQPDLATYARESIVSRTAASTKLFTTDDAWSDLIETSDSTKKMLFYLALPLAYVFDFLL